MEKIRILLAEDHTLVREGIRELLSDRAEFEIVGEASNGEEAVQLAGQVNPDVVLMDIAMPVLNGIEATRRLKQAYPSISVLILSAHYSHELIMAVLEAGAAGYLLKDVRGRELQNCIMAVYEGESVLHPAVAQKVFQSFGASKGASEPASRVSGKLTERELEVLQLAMEGLSNEKLAERLSLGARTVQTHWRNIFNKLGVSSRTEAILACLRNGWIELNDPVVRHTQANEGNT